MWILSLIGGALGVLKALLGMARDRKLIKAGEARVTIQRLEGAQNDMRKARKVDLGVDTDKRERDRMLGKYRSRK